MPSRQCLVPTCPNPVFEGGSRCAEHPSGRSGKVWKKTPQQRARDPYYKTAEWRKRRARQLAKEPWCAHCGGKAIVADHIEPRGLGGDPNGPLQSLCKPCHLRKSAAEGREAQRRMKRGEL